MTGWGAGTFSWGQQQQQPEPQETTFQFTDDMFLSERSIPNSRVKEFVDVHESIGKMAQEMHEQVVSHEVEEEIASIRKDTDATLRGSLIEVCHLIDDGNSVLKAERNDLELSSGEGSGSSQKSVPTPFIKHYVEDILQTAEFIRQNLMAFGGDLNTSSDGVKVFRVMLETQHAAVLRCAERVAHVKENLERVRDDLERKLKTPLLMRETHEEPEALTTVERSKLDYKQYIWDQKARRKKRLDEMDLFGATEAAETAQQTSTSSFGSGFGSGGFGSGGFGKSGGFGTSGGFGSGTAAKPGTPQRTSGGVK